MAWVTNPAGSCIHSPPVLSAPVSEPVVEDIVLNRVVVLELGKGQEEEDLAAGLEAVRVGAVIGLGTIPPVLL